MVVKTASTMGVEYVTSTEIQLLSKQNELLLCKTGSRLSQSFKWIGVTMAPCDVRARNGPMISRHIPLGSLTLSPQAQESWPWAVGQ